MRKIKVLCSFGLVFAGFTSAALIALTMGSAVADSQQPWSASEPANPREVSPAHEVESVTVAPKTIKGLRDKDATPGRRQISDGR